MRWAVSGRVCGGFGPFSFWVGFGSLGVWVGLDLFIVLGFGPFGVQTHQVFGFRPFLVFP